MLIWRSAYLTDELTGFKILERQETAVRFFICDVSTDIVSGSNYSIYYSW